jgi:DNA-binding NtrC family response regulator
VSGLVIAWSATEPHRVGEIAFLGDVRGVVLGRGDGFGGRRTDLGRVVFVQQRPAVTFPTPPLSAPGMSREQLVLRTRGEDVEVEVTGQAACAINGRPFERGRLEPGDTLLVKGSMLFLCVRRTERMSSARSYPPDAAGPFGYSDRHGLVGESPAAWRLREGIGQIARAERHTLIAGPEGAELDSVVRAVVALSPRAELPVERMRADQISPRALAMTLRDRSQRADRTIILEELERLTVEQGAELAYALARPLGGGPLAARVLCMTTRDPYEIPAELLQQITPALIVPGLDKRRDDVPILARQMVIALAHKNPEIGRRFVDEIGYPRFDPLLMERLVRHGYSWHTRELGDLLLRAIAWSPESTLALQPEVESEIEARAAQEAEIAIEAISPRAIIACLQRNQGSLTAAARELGLPNRTALYRLMKKLGLETREPRSRP